MNRGKEETEGGTSGKKRGGTAVVGLALQWGREKSPLWDVKGSQSENKSRGHVGRNRLKSLSKYQDLFVDFSL